MESIPKFEEIDFQKYLLILQRRWIPAAGVFGVVVTLAFLYAVSLKPAYKAEGSLLIKTNRSASLTGLGEGIGQVDSLVNTNSPSDTQAKIVVSVPVIQETIRVLKLKNERGKFIQTQDLSHKLKVESSKGTDILQISYTDKDPTLAAKVVNKVMDAYIRNNIEANRAEAVSARKFISQQLPATEISVRGAELALRKFKEENKIIALQEEASTAVQVISRLEEQINQTQAKLVEVGARTKKLQKQANVNSQQAVTLASLSQIPGVQQVLTQRQEAQSQLAIELIRLRPNHPTIINLKEKIAVLNLLLKGRIEEGVGSTKTVIKGNLQIGELRQGLIADFARSEVERAGLEGEITTLSNKLSVYKKRANGLPKFEQTQRQLERKLKAAQTTYEALLTKLQEVQVAENQNIGNARIISPALIPDAPAASQKNLIVLGGGIFGAMLGLIAALTLDMIDRSVKTVKEARELLQYTLLGVIPLVGRNTKNSSLLPGGEQPFAIPRLIGRDIPHYPIGNAYQMLQANLKFLGSDEELKAIAVTSSVAKEGKSEVAANLAVAIAQLGRRVLLVDADMRHPVQHHIWGMTNAVGLSNVIVDQVPLNKAVQEFIPNLYVLTSGVIPPNSIALLGSKRMDSLVKIFAKEYDFVIFDTPPLTGIPDAAVLGKMTDGILLVVRPGIVDSASASAAKEFLDQSGQQVLGMVINGVNVKLEPDSYFYYSKESIEQDAPSPKSVLIKEAAAKVMDDRYF
ncbi:polysaccharide biosynthesis tyrosine autokinase [Calothrix sp. PCC 7507]|uniref:GumC family protein n=1 Tax=Calothrix sp. PCC 7507 TaxID=99598 RepID=UPI00029ED4BA|nr:polysaccharide biosynthesis tyrosine autokinase [Calothrix sp. PCC 7507]AFY32535.1 capsular exopolysaccharide family [Calothrix sp. PCC 7507]